MKNCCARKIRKCFDHLNVSTKAKCLTSEFRIDYVEHFCKIFHGFSYASLMAGPSV